MATHLTCDRCKREMPEKISITLPEVPGYRLPVRQRLVPHMRVFAGRIIWIGGDDMGDVRGDLCEECGTFIRDIVNRLIADPRVKEVEFKGSKETSE